MKKTLSLVLCVLLILSSFYIISSAAPSSLEINGESYFYVPEDYNIDAAHFSVKFLYKTDKLVDLSNTVSPAECITNVTTDATFKGSSANADANAFAQKVNSAATETFDISQIQLSDLLNLSSLIPSTSGKKVQVPYTITVANENVVGSVDYTILVTGLYKGELSSSTTFFNTTTKYTAVIDKVTSAVITSVNAETSYKDNEEIKLNEVEATVTSENGKSGVIKYSDAPGFFTAAPVGTDKLTVGTTAVDVTFDGAVCEPFTVNVTVDHAWGTKVTSISKLYHAVVCEGCGEVDVATKEEHGYNESVYNDDATFFKDGTNSYICPDCGEAYIELAEGTAGYCTKFANYKFLYVICDYISLIFDIITGVEAVQG